MKKSITLFLTLIFLITAISIVSVIIKKVSSLNTSYDFPQSSKIIQNTDNFLKKTDIKTILKYFDTPLFFSSKNGEFKAKIVIFPICSININDYLIKNRKNPDIERLLDFLLDKYEVKDPVFLKDLILDTIDSDDIERSPKSEIKEQTFTFQDGGIFSFEHFKKILRYYEKEAEDKSVENIEWRKYFNFYKTQLFKECAPEEIITLNDKNETKFNIISYENNVTDFLTQINIAYKLQKTHNIKIIYDIKQKKVTDIEENPLY